MAEAFSNIGSAVLNMGGTLSSGATSLTVATQINVPSSGTFRALIENEIIKVTAVSGATWTVSRGDGGTSAVTHTDGLPIHIIVTKEALDALVSIQAAGTETSNRRILNFIGATVADNSGSERCDITIPSAIGARVSSSSGAFDLSAGLWFTRTLTGSNGTLSLSNEVTNQEFTIELLQDSTGGRTITWFSTITWITPTGNAPNISLGANTYTLLRFKQTSSGNYIGWQVATQMNYASTIKATSGLVSYYKLDEASGTSAADSFGANTGTYTGGFTLGLPCRPGLGNAVQMNGSTAYVLLPTISLTALSIECWVYYSNAGQDAMLVEKDTVNSNWELLLTGSQLRWRGGSSSDAIVITAPVINTWHHIVATQTGTTAFLYVNGVQMGTTTGASALGNSGSAINIGRYNSGFYYTGLIAHVAIYNSVLSGATVLNHYNTAVLNPPW